MRWRPSSPRAMWSSLGHSAIPMMACGDSSSGTPPGTSCSSVVLVHEGRSPRIAREAAGLMAADHDDPPRASEALRTAAFTVLGLVVVAVLWVLRDVLLLVGFAALLAF